MTYKVSTGTLNLCSLTHPILKENNRFTMRCYIIAFPPVDRPYQLRFAHLEVLVSCQVLDWLLGRKIRHAVHISWLHLLLNQRFVILFGLGQVFFGSGISASSVFCFFVQWWGITYPAPDHAPFRQCVVC